MLAILTTHPIQYQVPIWQELARRNVDFEVWYLSDHGTRQSVDVEFGQTFKWDLDLLEGYPHRFLSPRGENAKPITFRALRVGSLAALFKAKQVDALWIHGWQVQAFWQAAFQAFRAGIPVWLRGESNDLRVNSQIKSKIKKLALNQLFARTSHFLYIGSSNKRFYQSYGIEEKQLLPAPYCVDNARFSQAATLFRSRRDELRHNWGIEPEATCFLFCGKFIPKKRPLDILEAARLALENNPNLRNKIHLLLVGDGALRGELEAKARELEQRFGRSLVTFVGFLNQQDIPQAYVVADYLILPSDFGETWGLVVNEAMACGIPALVSDQVGSAEDLALPLGEEFVFSCGDIAELSQKMTYHIEHPCSFDLKALIDKFDTHRTVDTVQKLYSARVGVRE